MAKRPREVHGAPAEAARAALPPARVICGEGGRLFAEGPQARVGEAAPRKAPTGQERREAKGLRGIGDRSSRGGAWGAKPRPALIAP